MQNINTEKCIEVLHMQLREKYIFLFISITVIVVASILMIVFLYRHNKKQDFLNKLLERESTLKKDNIKLLIGSIIPIVLLIGVGFMCNKEISKCKYDIDNKAFCCVEGNFSVITENYGHGRGNYQPTYELIHMVDGKRVKMTIDVDYCHIEPGYYTDCVLVYGEKTKAVVDFFEKSK